LLPDVDGRSAIARRYRDIVSAILVDQGGADQCSEARKQLIRRFAAASVLAEQMEAALAIFFESVNFAINRPSHRAFAQPLHLRKRQALAVADAGQYRSLNQGELAGQWISQFAK
jgi:hypothetical protein